MHARRTAATLLAGGLLTLGSASPALASAVCDAYSGECTPQPSVSVIPSVNDRTPPPVTQRSPGATVTTQDDAATLPFTGGELVLLSAVGVGALAGGVALVAAGRRRKPETSA